MHAARRPPMPRATPVEGLDVGALAAGLRAASGSGPDGPPSIAQRGRAVLERTLLTAAPVGVRLALDDGAEEEAHGVLFLAAPVSGRVGSALTLCEGAAGGDTLAVVALAPESRDAFRGWPADPAGPARSAAPDVRDVAGGIALGAPDALDALLETDRAG